MWVEGIRVYRVSASGCRHLGTGFTGFKFTGILGPGQ